MPGWSRSRFMSVNASLFKKPKFVGNLNFPCRYFNMRRRDVIPFRFSKNFWNFLGNNSLEGKVKFDCNHFFGDLYSAENYALLYTLPLKKAQLLAKTNDNCSIVSPNRSQSIFHQILLVGELFPKELQKIFSRNGMESLPLKNASK